MFNFKYERINKNCIHIIVLFLIVTFFLLNIKCYDELLIRKGKKKKEEKTSTMYETQNTNTNKLVKLCNAIMILLTISLLLVCQGIEENPGPTKKSEILTYNCNGLGDRNKLKRLLNKLNDKVSAGAIILLQETHIVNTDYLKLVWKHKFLSNCNKTNAAGVITLFSDKYEIKYSHDDNDGRHIIAMLTNEDENIIVSNVYFPNDHKEGIAFAEKVYLKIIELQNEYPNNSTICAGDFNMCMSTEDSIGRK